MSRNRSTRPMSACQPEEQTQFERRVGHRFVNSLLLRDALTHRSYVHESTVPGTVSNERLEYLGDAVLQLLSASLLYAGFPDAAEGDLSTLRAALVRASTLARFARQIELGASLRLGRGEDSTGGRNRDLLIASAFEAVVGALYLDGGIGAAADFVNPLLHSELEQLRTHTRLKDDKSLLQELAQARLGVTPEYIVVHESGPSHNRTFVVEVALGGRVAGRAEGSSKRQAEQNAAKQALRDDGWHEAGGDVLDTSRPDS